MIRRVLRILYPPKCLLCQKLLDKQETDLCHSCRMEQPEFFTAKKNISFIAQWTALWYYVGDVRNCLHRFKFYGVRSHAKPLGRLLAMHLMKEGFDKVDLITWAPISLKRNWERGYDQDKLICKAVAKELELPAASVLKKHRHTQAQSSLMDASQRRANVLGAYKVRDPKLVAGKRILLIDDIVTTGATASECARTLLTAGAKEVIFAAVAASEKYK